MMEEDRVKGQMSLPGLGDRGRFIWRCKHGTPMRYALNCEGCVAEDEAAEDR